MTCLATFPLRSQKATKETWRKPRERERERDRDKCSWEIGERGSGGAVTEGGKSPSERERERELINA